ncbi:MAG: methyltransferase domain-containing protein [Gammaproteobacteria bacterium]
MTTGPDRHAVARAFGRVAGVYASADFMHAEIAARLRERLDLVTLQPATILDLGAGPPQATAPLASRYPDAQLLAVDLAPAMLGTAAQPWQRLCADAAQLPLADHSIDLVVAGMLLHWCENPAAVLGEIRRVLRVPGLLLLTTLGPDTLRELRGAWEQVDELPHALAFTEMHNLGDALVRAGFAEPVVEVERLTVSYGEPGQLLSDLRSVGAGDLGPGRRRSLTGPGRWRAMLAALEAGRRADGSLPVTIEVIYAHAWTSAQRHAAPGEGIEIPLERVRFRRA